jgi:hypothetical protein
MPEFRRPDSGSREIVAADVMYRPASSSWWTRSGSFVASIWSPVQTTSWTDALSDSTSVVGIGLPSRRAYSGTMFLTSAPMLSATRSYDPWRFRSIGIGEPLMFLNRTAGKPG